MEIWLNRVFRVLKFLLNIVNRVRFIVFFFSIEVYFMNLVICNFNNFFFIKNMFVLAKLEVRSLKVVSEMIPL